MSEIDVTADASKLATRWATDARWQGVERRYTAEDVLRLRGSFAVEHTLARMGAERLWSLLREKPYVFRRSRPF